MTDTAELVKRLDKAIAMDAPTASDYEWSELLAAAMDAKDAIARLEAERDAAFLAGVEAGIEAAAQLAKKWRNENQMSAAKARKSISEGSRNMAEMLDGAAIECNAIMGALRAIDPATIAKELKDAG